MRRRALIGLGLALVGCHPTESLPVPPLDGAPSGLLIHTVADEIVFVQGLETSDRALPTFARREDAALHLVRFGCSLEALGIPAEPPLLEDTARATLDVPAPIDTLTLELRDDRDPRWIADPEPPSVVTQALNRLAVPDDNLCRLHEVPVVAETTVAEVANTRDLINPNFGLRLEGGDVLIATQFYVDLNRTSSTGYANYRWRDGQPSVWPQMDALGVLEAGEARDDGDLWLVGPETLWLGHPDRSFTAVTSTVFEPRPERMRLSGSGDGAELFMVVESELPGGVAPFFPTRRWLLRLTPTGWQTILRRDLERSEGDSMWVLHVGPGEAIATGFSETPGQVTRVKDGLPIQDEFGTAAATYLQQVPGWGPILGDEGGGLHVYDADEWRTLRNDGHPRSFTYIEPLADGLLLFGGFNLEVGQYAPDRVKCPIRRIGPPGPRGAVRLGDGALLRLNAPLAGGSLRTTRVTWVTEVQPICRE